MKKSILRSVKFTAITVISALICICVACADNSINERSPNNNGEVDRFLGEKYKITFNGNGGTVSPSSDTTDANGNITLPSAPKKDGYTFDGWYTAATGGNKVTAYTVFDKNTTIYARWTLITYTITFNSRRGGSVNLTYDTTVAGGKLASLPIPTQDGYKFNGWFTSATGGTAVSTSTVFDRNTTIYAQWTLVTYTITFNPNSGSVNPTSDTTGEGGTLASLPTPTRNGYTFVGWFTSSSGGTAVNTSTVFEKNTTIYAQWTLITYTITFDANGGSVNSTSGTTGTNGRLASLPTPTRSGYTFDGWYTSSSGGTQVTTSTTFSGNTTVYAKWVSGSVPTYKITFNANGGSVSPTSGTTGASGTLSSLPTPTRSGYTFDGWFTSSSGGTQVTTSTTFSASATVYARWTQQYTITFHANGGSGTVSSINAQDGDRVTLPSGNNLSRSGYTFDGWNTNSSGSGNTYDVGDRYTPTGNVTLYAIWKAVPADTYTITFNANGGSVSPTSGTTGASGTLSSLPTPTRNGYTFDGWFTSSSGGTQVTTSTTFSASATVYARWTQQYTITFHANNGTGSPPSPQTVNAGSSITLPNGGGLSRSGYTFRGWSTSSDGAGNKYNANSSYTPTGNVTLYAMWTSTGGTPTPTKTNFTDSRDNTVYTKVTIGTQTWMAENLNYDVPNATSDVCYQKSEDSCAKYGRLYNWSTAMDGANSSSSNPSGVQGVCPVDWHLPSDTEWTTLVNYAGGSSIAGTNLKSPQYWESYIRVPEGTDTFGFSALPGGSGYGDGSFRNVGYSGIWWSATENDANKAWDRDIGYNYEFVGWIDNPKAGLYSVRCVAD